MHDSPSPCPYLPGNIARLPLRLPIRGLRGAEFDERLEQGDRRQGLLLYRTHCPDCAACEPIRLDVAEFSPRRTHRRVLKRGDAAITVEVGPLAATQEKTDLYNRHKRGRGLNSGDDEIDVDGYRAFLGESCCNSFEVRYHVDGRLVGVAITDRTRQALSAVYCYFDPEFERLSLGTYSILTQVRLARKWGLRFVYLGLFIENCGSMAYKGRFIPHERRRDGQWERIDELPELTP